MIVGIWWIIIAFITPIGFENFLYYLMTHKTYIQPSSCLVHGFSCIEVVIYDIKPVGYCFFFHYIIFCGFWGKDTTFP